jgi:4-oxalocrotonate tautomerase
VNIKITREGVTPEQKTQLITGVTQLLSDVLGKNPVTTMVVIDEVDTNNWGVGGESVTVRRKKKRINAVGACGCRGGATYRSRAREENS